MRVRRRRHPYLSPACEYSYFHLYRAAVEARYRDVCRALIAVYRSLCTVVL
jgi:hypothetical protein